MFSTISYCQLYFQSSFSCVFLKPQHCLKWPLKVAIWNVFGTEVDMASVTMTPSCQSSQFIV